MTSLSVAYGAQIAAAASHHGLDPRLLAAVAAQETGGPGSDSGRNVVGDGGHGRGIFQIDDRYHAFARGGAAMDPSANADYAAGILQSNLRRYGGDVKAALSAYNAGSPGATGTRTDWGDGKPVGYADSVLRHYARLGGSAAAPAPGSSPGAGSGGLGARSAAEDPRDLGELVNALQSLAGSLGGATSCPVQIPPYRPLPQIDQRTVQDVAPSAAAGDDPSQPAPSA